MIQEIDAFGRDAMPGYDDLAKARARGIGPHALTWARRLL